MKIFGYRVHKCNDPWDQDAPPWAVEIGEMLYAMILQNEAMLALLQKRANQLTPEDQAKVNAIFAEARDITRKIDEAQK